MLVSSFTLDNSRPEITAAHMEIARRAARSAKHKWPNYDLSDLEWAAYGGLTTAWEKWLGNCPFEHLAKMYCRYAILRYMSKTAARYHIAPMVSLYEPVDRDDSDNHIRLLLDTIECPVSVADLVEAQEELTALFSALDQEAPIVRDSVLRNGTDTEIAHRYDRADSRSMRQYRERFIRDFRLSWYTGKMYRSTSRKR